MNQNNTAPCPRLSARLGRGAVPVVLGLLLAALGGCTTVKFTQKNPWTGEIWTVYSNTLGGDSVTYCPPPEQGACREAVFTDGPPPAQPPAAIPAAPQ